jgi:hypothetical protein
MQILKQVQDDTSIDFKTMLKQVQRSAQDDGMGLIGMKEDN